MTIRKRGVQAAVPDNIKAFLNDIQLLALHHMESYGWQLWFVRRPLFQVPVAVVKDAEGERVGVLEIDGQVNMQPGLQLRP
ncbi:hypothetical protein KO507_02620 [Gilvimarinus agarilyticus]|uniref:hypothetical protein n=1 Tax=unclassified Gilvimarinus TaxID=2642066 RepID=UPI001C0A457B|nr:MULTISPECIES: hypothetical protein [unclassified Gilvimarinus]MBU2884654.1 hypothetical protein [Gilvimarinus agarilyticus]MDO6569761.1 hypothetical protein [Gilvimarinus sp. 2_MG-2023]MDO6747425.1 hypothetical protein [Gilvimarinus sp. 1_MG-2023]